MLMLLTDPEVRYQMLRPAQIVDRRRACPIVYIPLGNIEWHGVQNPLGADTLQAEGIAIRAAQKGGGLVLPPLWYFFPHHETMEWCAADKEAIADTMQLPVGDFPQEQDPSRIRDQNAHYQDLLFDLLVFAETLGFQVGVFISGHYPLISHATVAAHQFAVRRAPFSDQDHTPLLPWAVLEPALRWQLEGGLSAGDHGGGWETSNVMWLHPNTVDLTNLPAEGEPLIGCGGRIPPQQATAERGKANIEAVSDLIVKESMHRLTHPDWYRGAPYLFSLGKWQE